jgi:hypothetical protein
LVYFENVRGAESFLRLFQWILLGFLIIFIGFRLMGPDYTSYKRYYLSNENLTGTFEPFFVWTIQFFQSIPLSFQAYLVFIATLSVSIKAYVIRRYSPYFYLSMLVALMNYFLSDMGQIRFSLAIATIWLSLQYCEKKDIKRFLIVCTVAYTMHVSSLIFIPAYFLPSFRIKLPYMLLIWVGCVIFSFILDNSFISDWVNSLARDSMIDTKVSSYTSDEEQTFTSRVKFTVMGTVVKVFQLVLFTYATMENDRLKTFFINAYFVGGCLFFFFAFSEIMSARLSIYYFSFEVLSIPCFLYYVQDKLTYWSLISAFTLKAFYQLYVLIFHELPMFYVPYRNSLLPFLNF